MRDLRNRLRFLSLFILLFALLVTSRLYMVQVVARESFEAQAEQQYIAGPNFFDRGSILFTTKDDIQVPAASVRHGFLLFINPNILRPLGQSEIERIYEEVNAIVPLDKEIFISRATKENDPYEELARRLGADKAEKIKDLKIAGVSVARDKWRVYPGEKTASHTIGLIGYSGGNELAGRYGLERQYEEILKRSGDGVFINFFAEMFSNIKQVVGEEDDLEGSVVTTIEPTVQAFLESEIKRVTEKYSSDFTGGIVIDPMTGEITAMALVPDFDPNFPQNERDPNVFRNRLVEDRYEMGSILKALTLAIGLDTGAITANTTYNDPGCMIMNTKTFCNYDGKSHGASVSMQTVLAKSLNTGAAYISSRVGSRKFSEAMLNFGLESLSGIDLPNEGRSLVSNLKTGRELEPAQASFGQGVALTPINTVRALSVLANGGTLITPHIVKEIQYELGPTKKIIYPSAEERKRVLKEETSIEISRMLTEVVDRTLREGQVRLENYSVAAKTGTAQIAREGGGGYYDDRYLHSFFGYFPSYEPEHLVFLFTYHPKGVQYASETLTDSFMNITKFIINYYNIPPDRDSPPPLTRI